MLNSVSKKGVSKKLQPIYVGPYLLVSKVSDCLFLIVNSRGKRQVMHHDRLRRCSDENIPLWARRERRKMEDLPDEEEGRVEGNEEEAETRLDTFFDEAPEENQIEQPKKDAGSTGGGGCQNGAASPPLGSADATDCPPIRVSDRPRRRTRKPDWLQDCITEKCSL